MIRIYSIKIDNEFTLKTQEIFTQIISDERRKRIERYLFEEDKKRGILVECLLRYSLIKDFGLSNQLIHFQYNKYGKPALETCSDIQFNLSHSKDWAICCIGDVNMGIDIEYAKQKNNILAYKAFSKNEIEELNRLDGEERNSYFYRLWTLKESYVKAIGKGITIPFSSFEISYQQGQVRYVAPEDDKGHYHFISMCYDKNYFLALCAASENNHLDSIPIQRLSIKVLSEILF